MKKILFMINQALIIFFSYNLYASSIISDDDLKNFGYHYGIMEKVRSIRQTHFLEKNNISMEEGYKKLVQGLQTKLPPQIFYFSFMKGCRQTEKPFGRYTLIKVAEEFLEKSFHDLQDLDETNNKILNKSNSCEDYLSNLKAVGHLNYTLVEQVGIWRGGEILYNDQKNRFDFLKNYPDLKSDLLISPYEEGKQAAASLETDELLVQYEKSGTFLMNIYHTCRDFLPKGKGMSTN